MYQAESLFIKLNIPERNNIMAGISLTASQRSSLLSLQNTESLSSRTQGRLSTGRAVNSVVDDAVKYFKSKGLSDRASDFDLRKDGIDQGISTINSALQAVEAIDKLVKQMKGVVEAAKSQTTAERTASTTQFKEIGKQISLLVEDASYGGLNLINSTNSKLDVAFGIRTQSRLVVSGIDLNSTGATNALFGVTDSFSANGALGASALGLSAGGFTIFGVNNSNVGAAAAITLALDKGISNLRAQAATLGGNVAILQTRLDFTNNYVNEMEAGSDKMTLADLNEEGANLIALQTRQQLGIQALSIAGKQQQAVLSLIQ